ncbi:MAG: hypothetical protein JNL74_21300 [Fibrobacteres bacterium]|nr:hypothetical protein [Fibrobacterota bacterium]
MTPPFFFLLLGAAIFAIETVAIQWNIRAFGGASASTGAALLAFFAGSGLGYLYYSRRALRLNSKFIISLVLSLLWLPIVYKLLDSADFIHRNSGFTLKVLLSIFATFPAYFTFSAFFPAASKLLDGKSTTSLYAWNTAGTLAGVILASFVLPPIAGYRLIYLASSALLLCGAIYLSVNSRNESLKVLSARAPLPARNILIAAFISGTAGILYETVLIRQMAVATDNTAYSFGSVTFFYILFAALASALIARLPSKVLSAKPFFPLSATTAALGILYSATIFISETNGLATVVIDNSAGPFSSLLFALKIFWPSLIPITLVFPQIIRSAPAGSGGFVLAANMTGGAAGALLGGFILIPNAGLWGMTLVAALLYPLLTYIYGRGNRWNLTAAASIVILLFIKPWNFPKITPDAISAGMKGAPQLIDVKEGRYGIVSVVSFGGNKTLWLNSSYVLGGNRSPSDDRRLGFLPSLLAKEHKDAAVIGIATGISLSGLMPFNWHNINGVEIVPEIVEMAKLHFAEDNNNALTKQSVETAIEDGRHFLKGKRQAYDLIVSDLFIPWQEGSAALYSVEHFHGIKNSLKEDGLFMLWLPMYELTHEEFTLILRTLCAEFPIVSIWQNGFSSKAPVVGLCASLSKLNSELISNNFGLITDSTSSDQIRRHPAALFARCIGVANQYSVGTSPINTLDKPILGFWAAKADRKLLIDDRYIHELSMLSNGAIMTDAFTTWTTEMELWRKAGVSMTLSVYELLNGNREAAYSHFDSYKNAMPQSLQRP